MTPAQKVQLLHNEWLRQKARVQKECDTLDGALALIKLWPGASLCDAIGAEAKRRALAALEVNTNE